jgi:F-type H+-transporting ATPase subunit epsilon
MLKLEIVTPERKVLEADVDSVNVPTVSGEVGIMPSHAPLVSALRPGVVSYSGKAASGKLAVASGFVQVNNNKVSLLVDTAATADDVDIEAAKAEKEAADKAAASALMSAEEAEASRDAIDLAAAKIAVASK